jgi:hypothetical protein|tara:strand:- start:43048 stop:43344 length:297 start_codon:yes stop_codon:yes gene_type:complete
MVTFFYGALATIVLWLLGRYWWLGRCAHDEAVWTVQRHRRRRRCLACAQFVDYGGWSEGPPDGVRVTARRIRLEERHDAESDRGTADRKHVGRQDVDH